MLRSAQISIDLSQMYLQNVNAVGAVKADPQERPLQHAFEADEISKALLGDEPNYIVAKAVSNLGKIYLVKGDQARKTLKKDEQN